MEERQDRRVTGSWGEVEERRERNGGFVSRYGESLTVEELKQRLKHIAGLCWGLCCDIGNFEAENAELRQRVQEYERIAQERSLVCPRGCYSQKRRNYLKNRQKRALETQEGQTEGGTHDIHDLDV